MAYFERHLTALMIFFAAFLALRGHAQTAPVEPPAKFCTLALGMADIVDLHYDLKHGRSMSVAATNGNFSSPYLVPSDGLVSFYRLVAPVPPETKPQRVPVGEVRFGKGGGPWLLLMKSPNGPDAPIQLQIVDDSWTAHPVHTMRIFNFSTRRAGVNIGESTFELNTGESKVIAYPASADPVWMKVAVMEESGWTLRVAGPKAMIPKTRSTFILADAPIEPSRPDFKGVMTSTLIDMEPKPPVSAALASHP